MKGCLTSPTKPQPLLCASSNETFPAAAAASDDTEGTLGAGGDENQMIARKASRSKGAVNPERALERAAKVGWFSFTDIMTVFLIQ